jgi:hypothetical protein
MKGDNPTSFESPGTRQLSIKKIESSTAIGQCSKPETPPANNGSSSSIKFVRDIMRERAAREATRKAEQEQKEELERIREEESFYSVQQRQRNELIGQSLGKGRFANRAPYQTGEEYDDSNSSYSSGKAPTVKDRRLRGPHTPSSASMFTPRSYPDPKPQNNDSHGSRLKRRSGSDIGVVPILKPVQKSQQLRIGDASKVQDFHFSRFRDMGSRACREMANAFLGIEELKDLAQGPDSALWLPLITPKKDQHNSMTGKNNMKSPEYSNNERIP